MTHTSCMCTVVHLCPTLRPPMDWSPPGSSVHGIFQARILECVAISFSRGSSRSRDQTCVSLHFLLWKVDSLPLSFPRWIQCHLESPWGRMDTRIHMAESLCCSCEAIMTVFVHWLYSGGAEVKIEVQET